LIKPDHDFAPVSTACGRRSVGKTARGTGTGALDAATVRTGRCSAPAKAIDLELERDVPALVLDWRPTQQR